MKTDLPLSNNTIVLTRSKSQSHESVELFEKLGARVIQLPTIEIVPVLDVEEFITAVNKPESIDYLIFTSANAVKYFTELLENSNIPIDLTKTQVAAVGTKTKKVCDDYGYKISILPKEFSAVGLLHTLSKVDIEGKNILIPRSKKGRNELVEGIKKLSGNPIDLPVYDVIKPSAKDLEEPIRQIQNEKLEWFVFTSPSTYKNFLEINEVTNPVQFFSRYKVAAIGPVTKEAIESTDVKVTLFPSEYTMESLAEDISNFHTAEIIKSNTE